MCKIDDLKYLLEYPHLELNGVQCSSMGVDSINGYAVGICMH